MDSKSALSAMETGDMDVDMDIDLGPIDDGEVFQPVSRPAKRILLT